jgi:RHS repeat-associated protein
MPPSLEAAALLSPTHACRRLTNHLQEVVGADYSNLVGGAPGWSWKHPQPFSSGGSDQFTGHKHDSETGLKYFGARYYHESAARWTSPDAVLYHRYDPQSLNKYAYVRNDPVNLADSDGKEWIWVRAPWNDLYGLEGMLIEEGWTEVWNPERIESDNTPIVEVPGCDPDGYRDATPAEAQAILDYAIKFAGTPYKSGGNDKTGMDCSGLIYRVLTDTGYYSGPDFSTSGIPALSIVRLMSDSETLTAGDILLFPGHVGFYDPKPPADDPKDPEIKIKPYWNLFSALGSSDNPKYVTWGSPRWFDPTWNGQTGTGSNTKRFRVRVPCKK